MALKKPSDFFGIEKVSTLNEQVEQISQDNCSDLEENISLSFSNIDGVFKNIQEQLLTSGKNQIVEVKDDLVQLYKVVDDLIENEIPKYKKQVNTSELRVETRISNLKKDLCKHFEDQVKDTKEKIEELYKEVINEEVFNARSFVKSLYNNEIQTAVEKYVSTYSNDIVSLREEIFKEIKKKPNGLAAIESKLQDLAYKYKVLSENLNDKNNNDPLLQSPVTFEQLKNHYQLLVGRLQEQLASVGGGGEVRLKYLDDIVGIATNASAYNNKFLKYNHSIDKFEFVSVDAGTQDLNDTLQFGNSSSLGMSVGVTTVTSLNVDGVANFDTNAITFSSSSPTQIYSFSASQYRSARLQIQITQGTDYQTSDILLIHNGSVVNIVEYASISTNDYLGTFEALISSGNVSLRVLMGSSSLSTIKVVSQTISL